MALTRVAPAGIGSTPGTGYVIGDSFLHSRGLNAIDANYTGIVTAQSIRVIGDLQVDGTTTTLDTAITEVDKLEVGANNNTVGVAITQSGTGDILNLYDGSTAVFSVKDGGNVTLGTNATYANDTANDLQVGQTSSSNSGITIGSSSQGQIAFADAGANRAGLINYNHGSDAMIFYTNGPSNERLRITSDGDVNIGSSSSVLTQTTYKLQVETSTNKRISFGSAAHDDLSDEGPGIFFSRQSDGSPQISGIFGHGNTSLGLAARDSLTFHAGGTSSYNAAPERLRITSDGKVGIGSDVPRYSLDVHGGNLLVSGPSSGNLILEDRGVGDSSKPFHVVSSDGGKFVINRSDRNASGTTTGSVNSLTLSSSGNLGLGVQTSPAANIHIGDISNGYELKLTGNALQFNRSSNSYIDQVHDSGRILFRMGSSYTEAMRITSEGKVGINSTSPATAFDVVGQGHFKNNGSSVKIESVPGTNFTQIQLTNTGGSFYVGRENNSGNWFGTGSNYASVLRSDGAYPLIFRVNGANRLRITSDGKLCIGSASDVDLEYGTDVNAILQLSTTSTPKIILCRDDTSVSTNDYLGIIDFHSRDGGIKRVARIGARAGGNHGLDDGPTDLVFHTMGDNTATTAEERLRITYGGAVNIGGDYTQSAYKAQITGDLLIQKDQAAYQHPQIELYALNTGAYGGAIKFTGNLSGTKYTQATIRTYGGGNTSDGSLGFFTGNGTEKVRIESDGDVRVYAGSLTVKKGNSAIQLSEYENGAAIWLDGANGDFSGGDYFNIRANNSSQLTFGYAGSEHVKLTTSGYAYFGGYPTSHTVAGSSPIKVRAGAGAWGISIGMRSSQNDYAYIGFTDMNGTEHIGEIFMQRTAASTGHMVFSTNDGSGSNNNRLRIGNSGRVCISPDASFAAESTNIAMSIACSGGDIGGYPGIHIRSTDSGGGTNSQNGMCIVSTDGNWSLYSNAGNVHGLGILTGNSANSNNTAFYARSDRKITMGPGTADEAHSTNTCGQAVHIAGGSLGLGALSNYSAQSGTGGRHVLGWYHANAFTNKGSNTHLHLVTSLWGGGSPHGQSEFMMGGFHIHGYKYHSSGISEEIIYFHNWSGSLANYSRHHHGNWDPGNSAYVNSSGYVTIKLSAGNYYGYTIDLMTFNWYPVRDIRVTSTTFNTGANL